MKNWWEYLRFITPLLLTIALFMIGSINGEIEDLNNKIFVHLTNDDIHVTREYIVSKAEFDLLARVREGQFAKIESALAELRVLALEQIRKCSDGYKTDRR